MNQAANPVDPAVTPTRTRKKSKPFVLVLGADKRPLMPCTGKRARLLLERGRAAVYRRVPFTIILKDRTQDDCVLQPMVLKFDPGSKESGVCLGREDAEGNLYVHHLVEIKHRGDTIKLRLKDRTGYRKSRRSRLWHRPSRFNNRTGAWRQKFAPSIRSRGDNILAWIARYRRWAPITRLVIESVKFDTQLMQTPDICGDEYQNGELKGYNIKEYLLAKHKHTCVYCQGKSRDAILEVDHVVPRSKGGTNRLGNLTLSCRTCNQSKSNQDLDTWFKGSKQRLEAIKADLGTPLKDAGVMNVMRGYLLPKVQALGLPVELSAGYITKHNRKRLDIPKTHALDAACVGNVKAVHDWVRPWLDIEAMGRGNRILRALKAPVYKNGVKVKKGKVVTRSREKLSHGFQSGDIVISTKHQAGGSHYALGQITLANKEKGEFSFKTRNVSGKLVYEYSTTHVKCRVVQKADGYRYMQRPYNFRKASHSRSLHYLDV